MTKPYVYIIGWTKLKKFYIGSKWLKGCDPADLWNFTKYNNNRTGGYFTSSKHVTAFQYVNGEPDFIETYPCSSAKAAKSIEAKFLDRAAQNNDVWINRNFRQATGGWNKGQRQSEETKRKIGEGNRGKGSLRPPISEETRQLMSEARKGRPAWNKGKPLCEEHRSNLSKATKGKPKSEKAKRNMRGPKSEEHKRNLSKALKGNTNAQKTNNGMYEQ